MTATAEQSQAVSTQDATFIHFFDLPQEVRDMIYIYWPKIAWIDITQAHPKLSIAHPEKDKSVNQPNASKVCRRMRKECLDVFYGKNKFLLDLRGWKHSDYPRRWTPITIFEKWMEAIGDDNAARMRSLSFWSHNFAVHIKIANDRPFIRIKFRTAPSKVELAEGVPSSYSFNVAAKRAEQGLQSVIDRIEAERDGERLRADDLREIGRWVDRIQPFLCKRSNLGYMGATLPSSRVEDWPSGGMHTTKCDDCGYHRYTRGSD